MDFMIISPLGAIIMPDLAIGPQRFGEIVSAYAFSAGISGLLAAGFADRFDRKRFLLFFYAGFIVGTALCALAPNYPPAALARIVTGLFGGVIGSVVLAIATDLFPFQMRGRVMGVVQTAFSASQVLGIPAGLYLANLWNWHVTFLAIVLIAIPVGLIIYCYMKPVSGHLALKQDEQPVEASDRHCRGTEICDRVRHDGVACHWRLHAHAIRQRLHGEQSRHPLERAAHGLFRVRGLHDLHGPLVGRASDAFGKFNTFIFGCALSIVMVLIYTHLGHVSLFVVIAVSVLMFVGIFSRMIPSQALMSAIPRADETRLVQRDQRFDATNGGRHRLGHRRHRGYARPRGICSTSIGSDTSSSRRRCCLFG